MSSTMQFRIDPLERELITRAAEREGISASDLIRRSIRNEIAANPRGRIVVDVNPVVSDQLLDTAARLGHYPGAVVEALIRVHLDDIDEFDLDPTLRRTRAQQRAKELLNG